MRRTAISSLILLLAIAALATRSFLRLSAQSPTPAAQETWNASARQVLVRYGITDTAARNWRGWMEPASADARVLALAGYHFSNEDQVTTSDSGASEFSFSTRAWTPNVQQVDLSPVLPGPRAVFPNGIYATVSGAGAARFHVFDPARAAESGPAGDSLRRSVATPGAASGYRGRRARRGAG